MKSNDQIMSEKAAEPVGPYPHARKVGRFLFLSGIGPRQRGQKEIPGVVINADGTVKDHDIEIQTRAVVDNIKKVLEASGSSLEQVVDVQVFLTHMKRDFQKFNQVYGEYFAKIGPTRTTVEVTALPTPIAVELKVIADLGEAQG
jgi:2-aminomuconate deaminase